MRPSYKNFFLSRLAKCQHHTPYPLQTYSWSASSHLHNFGRRLWWASSPFDHQRSPQGSCCESLFKKMIVDAWLNKLMCFIGSIWCWWADYSARGCLKESVRWFNQQSWTVWCHFGWHFHCKSRAWNLQCQLFLQIKPLFCLAAEKLSKHY